MFALQIGLLIAACIAILVSFHKDYGMVPAIQIAVILIIIQEFVGLLAK